MNMFLKGWAANNSRFPLPLPFLSLTSAFLLPPPPPPAAAAALLQQHLLLILLLLVVVVLEQWRKPRQPPLARHEEAVPRRGRGPGDEARRRWQTVASVVNSPPPLPPPTRHGVINTTVPNVWRECLRLCVRVCVCESCSAVEPPTTHQRKTFPVRRSHASNKCKCKCSENPFAISFSGRRRKWCTKPPTHPHTHAH